MPTVPIEIGNSKESVGLQITDVYLWSFKKMLERQEMPGEFASWLKPALQRGRTDEISLNALATRWTRFFEEIPELEDMSEEQRAKGKELMELDEGRRQEALREAGLR